jgi:uncharacterized protein YdeI (YjbR/CyaY-like superfamily)
MNPKIDAFLSNVETWRDEFTSLRSIILDCQLNEEMKWRWPCYTFQDSNIVLMHGFKDYCALLFFKGALLKDEHGLLIQQTENMQAARQIRFRNVEEIVAQADVLKSFIHQAIDVEKAGLKIERKSTADYAVAEEFEAKLADMAELAAAFANLTPGRQKAYLLHFSAPKQSKTRVSRIEKATPAILMGKGLTD